MVRLVGGPETRSLEKSIEKGRFFKFRVGPASNATAVTHRTNTQKCSLVTNEKNWDSDSLKDMPKAPQLVGGRARVNHVF